MSIKKIKLVNFKNIKESQIEFKSNVSAIYGQNGSGKTAIVESVKILQMFFWGDYEKINERKKYITDRFRNNEVEMVLEFVFEFGIYEYLIKLDFLRRGEEIEVKESISRKDRGVEGKRKKYKLNYSFSNIETIIPDIYLGSSKFNVENFNDDIASTNIYKKMIKNNSYLISTFKAFSKLEEVNKDICDEVLEFIETSVKPISILELEDMGLFHLNFALPLAFHVQDENHVAHGKVPFFSSDNTNYYSETHSKFIINIISQINILFKEVVPQRTLEIRETNSRGDGNDREVQLEMYVCKNGEKIPLYKESTGIVKIISMLSVLIDFYNNENAIVVIDELDSHIFEFLLNELLRVLAGESKGQLIFTSHNFSVMESLSKDSIILSTMCNEDVCYNYFKNVSKTSNLRDKYIRAMAINSEPYIGAVDINEYKIKNALRISRGVGYE